MEILWSPWRSQYISTFNEKKNDSNSVLGGESLNCFLCDAINSKGEDIERLIVTRREKCIVVLNKYPYNSGHTLVVPLRHISDFCELTSEELTDIMQTTQEVITAMKDQMHPHGFNIGINIGQSAGAGLPGHLHFHIVPRWNGDSNFTATISDMKTISTDMERTRQELAKLLNK